MEWSYLYTYTGVGECFYDKYIDTYSYQYQLSSVNVFVSFFLFITSLVLSLSIALSFTVYYYFPNSSTHITYTDITLPTIPLSIYPSFLSVFIIIPPPVTSPLRLSVHLYGREQPLDMCPRGVLQCLASSHRGNGRL